MKKNILKYMLLGTTLISTVPAGADDFTTALTEGKADLSLRYRIESVDQKGLDKKAFASTLQTLLGYKTGDFNGFSAYVQFRDTRVIGEENYNNTINGKTEYPVVADPANTDIDQAYLQFSPSKNISMSIGRRKFSWGNQRFVSALGWRQNNRSFDSIAAEISSDDKNFSGKYIYAWNVNRAFSDKSPVGNFDSDIHLLNADYSGWKYGKLTTYGYLIGLNDAFALGLSSQTFGVNLTGKVPASNQMKVSYLVEYASQSDYKNNPDDYSENYFHGAAGIEHDAGLGIKVGYEYLGGNGNNAFMTPLALLHGFNGWADKFLSTPANGLEDKYVTASYSFAENSQLSGTKLMATYHDYDSTTNTMSYGTEFDVVASHTFAKRYSVMLKGAFYSADTYSVDTTKLWLAVSAKF